MPEFGFDALRTRRCECGAADCDAVVQISWAEADPIDHAPGGKLWIIHPEHTLLGAKSSRVVEENERFVVVEAEEE
jgi:hypothetical protein